MRPWNRRLAATTLAALTLVVFMQPQWAHADGVLNEFAPFAINVPSNLLVQSGGTAAADARIANDMTFDWAMATPVFAAVSGTLTPTPVPPSTVTLTPAEVAEFDRIVSRFAAPVTRASTLARGAGGPALISFTVGLQVGTAMARIVGFKDEQVCAEGSVVLEVAAAILDGTSCNSYENMLDEALRNATRTMYQDQATVGVDGATVTFLGPAGTNGFTGAPIQLCFRTNSPTEWGTTLIGPKIRHSIMVTTSTRSDSARGHLSSLDTSSRGCQVSYPSANDAAWAYAAGTYLADFSIKFYGQYGETVAQSNSFNYVSNDMSRENPVRKIKCVITTTGGQSYVAFSEPFTENDATFSPVKCPAVPSDNLTRDLLNRGWLVRTPTPSGYEFGVGEESAAVRLVAQTCVDLGVEDDCRDLPIFAPGDGVFEAAKHDLDTIAANPSLAVLTRQSGGYPSPGWYQKLAPCITGTYDAAGLQCDEYPYASTAQAGPPNASLRIVDKTHNQLEGTLLNMFYGVAAGCGVANGDNFVVIPIVVSPQSPVTATSAWCAQ